ncbi:MAG: LUD domain-containing protein [Selenomonadaceae bacterium]|nr:LUD domain-containing protein [Selenomonadaceae bacterium]
MEKVCQNWPGEAFDDTLVNPNSWKEFEENAKAAAAEIYRLPDMVAAKAKLEELLQELEVNKTVAVGGDEYPALAKLFSDLKAEGKEIYTDKFEIAEEVPTADLGISTAEFCIGETGSLCVDNYSYEARVTSMMPITNLVFVNANYTTKDVDTAFQVISKVFDKGYMGFVTGPSRTADIERVLSLGVHGPNRLIIFAMESGLERGSN